MTSESLTGAIVPSVARRISILSGHTDWQKESFSLGTAVLKSSQFPHDTSAKSTEKPKWQEEHDPALEVAVTPNTLKKLMQYHGSLVKVSISWQALLVLGAQSLLHLKGLIAILWHPAWSYEMAEFMAAPDRESVYCRKEIAKSFRNHIMVADLTSKLD